MFFVYVLLAIILLVVLVVANCIVVSENQGWGDKEQFGAWAAFNTIVLFLIFIWPLVIPLALVGLMCYGVYNIPTLVRMFRDETGA